MNEPILKKGQKPLFQWGEIPPPNSDTPQTTIHLATNDHLGKQDGRC